MPGEMEKGSIGRLSKTVEMKPAHPRGRLAARDMTILRLCCAVAHVGEVAYTVK